jgi:hypothetical protein
MIEYSDLEKLWKEIHDPRARRLVDRNLKDSLILWQQRYNQIKDPSWPECCELTDFDRLPSAIKQECIDIHKFSPDIWKQKITEDVTQRFILPPSVNDLKIVQQNSDVIVNKKIVEVACGHGRYSFACCQTGASSVLGFDIRNDNLKMAKAIQDFLKIPKKILTFTKLDIHDHKAVTKVCANKDTVLVPGIMYHVHDHYEILQAVAKSKVQNIIIETAESAEAVQSTQPLIWWTVENTFENLNGWIRDCQEIPVGYPNRAWFDLIMPYLGYKLISSSQYTISHSVNFPTQFPQIRTWYVFGKNQIDKNLNM